MDEEHESFRSDGTLQNALISGKTIMEVIRGEGQRNNEALESKLSASAMILLEVLTIVSISFERWMCIHFLKNSDVYFLVLWIENLYVVIFLHFYKKKYVNNHGFFRQFKLMPSLIIFYCIQVIVGGYDLITFTRKAGGTEFYQFNLALSVPVLLATMRVCKRDKLSSLIYYLMGVIAGWKLMILLQDREFVLTFSASILSLCFTIISCFYLIMLKEFLHNSIIELVYHLSYSLVLLLPICSIFNGEFSIIAQEFGLELIYQLLLKALLLAILKFFTLSFSLVFLKKNGPLRSLAVFNLCFVPDHFNQALVYKLDCTLAASKVCVLLLVDFIVVHFVDR